MNPNENGVREALEAVTASLAAAVSLLHLAPKTIASSDRMFDQMLADYEAALDEARAALSAEAGDGVAAALPSPLPSQGEPDWRDAFISYRDDPHSSKNLREAFFRGWYDREQIAAEALAAERARADELAEALKDCVDTLATVEREASVDPVYGDEVNRLGQRIGFGALMNSAQASWRKYLAEMGGPTGGEFVAGPCFATVQGTLRRARAALSPKEAGNV